MLPEQRWLQPSTPIKKMKAGEAKRREKEADEEVRSRIYEEEQAYFIGGGLASMAGASYLLRDCHFPGKHIHIFEGMDIFGGSNDGSGTGEDGVCLPGRKDAQ